MPERPGGVTPEAARRPPRGNVRGAYAERSRPQRPRSEAPKRKGGKRST